MPVTLDDHDGFEACSLVYRKWADAYDNLKRVRTEKPDYKFEPDWDSMHQIRLANTLEEERKWKALLTKFTNQLPSLT